MSKQPLYDVLVIGAGPTGLACAIDAQNAGCNVALVDKGCLQLALPLSRAHDFLHHAGVARDRRHTRFQSPNQKPSRERGARVLPQGRCALSSSTYATTSVVDQVSGADGDFTVHTDDRFGRPLRTSRTQAGRLHRLLRSAEPSRRSWRGSAARSSTTTTNRIPTLTATSSLSAARTQRPSRHWTSTVTARASHWFIAAPSCIVTSSTGSSPTSKTASRTAKSPLISTPPSTHRADDVIVETPVGREDSQERLRLRNHRLPT